MDFIDLLVNHAESRKVFLILANPCVHHALAAKEWLAERTAQIEVFYLPLFAPNANPDDYLNRDLKNSLRRQEPKRTRHDLWSAASTFTEFLERISERVRAYFTHSCVCRAC